MSGADERDARAILGPSAQFLAAGATCTAFTDGWRVVRLAAGPGARLVVQAAVMRALHEAGVPTPQVLEVGTFPSGRTYSLETLVEGDGDGPSAEGWADLGRALAALHALPHTGFGLLEDRADAFVGQTNTPGDGLRTRLQDAWPLGKTALSEHPLIRAAPELAPPLAGMRAGLEGAVRGETALCHTDLHREQFRWREGRLSALLDFGDAAIGPPAWDVASVAYFHGWEAAGATGLPVERDAALFGLLLAFHRASRARSQARLGEAAAFARSCLDHLG